MIRKVIAVAVPGNSVESVRSSAVRDSRKVRSFEAGSRWKLGKIHVVDLHGSFEEMGRQYGELMKLEIKQAYAAMFGNYFKKSTDDWWANTLYETHFPKDCQDFVKGVADSMGGDKTEALAKLKRLGAIHGYCQETSAGCSALAVWGSNTQNHSVIVGRNYDFFQGFKEMSCDLTITILHPDQGLSTALIGFPGVFECFTAMNKNGLFLEGNSTFTQKSMTSDNPYEKGYNSKGKHMTVNQLHSLLNSDTLENLQANLLRNTNTTYRFITTIADGRKASAIEYDSKNINGEDAKDADPKNHKIRPLPFDDKDDKKDLLVVTNHNRHTDWQYLSPEYYRQYKQWEDTGKKGTEPAFDPTKNNEYQTGTREEHLMARGLDFSKNQSMSDSDKMMAILDTLIDEGGATFPQQTIYQVVAEPKHKTLWIKTPAPPRADIEDYELPASENYQDKWVKVDLIQFFNPAKATA